MGSWSGGVNSSGSADHGLRTSDREVEKKRRRMQSNRESARRSRLRKQQHLDDLTDQMNRLRNHNNQIMSDMNITTNLYISLEAENSILRTQMAELTHRLQCLNDIVIFINSSTLFETLLFDEVDNLDEFDFEVEDYCNRWGSLLGI